MIYISLGYNCSPRSAIKARYKLSNASGYKTCPFDLCLTPFEGL